MAGPIKNNYVAAATSLLLLLSLATVIKFMVSFYLEPANGLRLPMGQLFRQGLVNNIYRSIYFMILGSFYWASSRIGAYRLQRLTAQQQQVILRREKSAIEQKFQQARNAYLEQQVSPHLLFNTLNFVYNKVFLSSPEAGRCVLLLADLMRFSLEEHDAEGRTALADELEQLSNLIVINQCRYDYPLSLNFSASGDFRGIRVIPLLLLTIAENLFKHGNLRLDFQLTCFRLLIFTACLNQPKADFNSFPCRF